MTARAIELARCQNDLGGYAVAGRLPKPTKLKLLQGTARPDRMPKNEPQPEAGMPARPGWLAPAAKREWSECLKPQCVLGFLYV